MSGVYGNAKSDTDFRTQKNAEYAQKAKDRQREKLEKQQKKVNIQETTEAKARDIPIDFTSSINKVQVVSADQAGFYCEHCDIYIKDHLTFIEHCNTKLHHQNAGIRYEVQVASLQDVLDRLEYWRNKQKEKEKPFDFEARIRELKEKEEEERALKKQKRKAQRSSKLEEKPELDPEQADMAAVMGFSSFGGQ